MKYNFSHLLAKFDSGEVKQKIEAHFDSDVSSSLVIYACDARTLTMYAEGNRYISLPYEAVDTILADGRPVYWLSKLWLNKSFQQTTGPGLFFDVLSSDKYRHKRHMFYGGTQSTISMLQERCVQTGVNVVHAESPPFLPIDNMEINKVNQLIKEHNPDFFWCGLGAPKQEYLLYQLDRDNNTVMVGVGLAFDYYAGKVQRAPKIISKLGLEWVMRYGQQPQRIARFIKPLFFVGTLVVKEFVKARFSSFRL